jgi:hypothetical protein
MRLGGRELKLLGIGLFVLGGIIYGVMPEDSLQVLLGVPVMLVGMFVHFRGRRHVAKLAAPNILSDSKPDVLYLRAFRSDAPNIMGGLTTDEEELAAAVRPFGDLVAIGKPGEPLPLPGAARIYASDAEWRDIVTAHMGTAPLVVLRAGVGSGLAWELGESMRVVEPQRLLILVRNLAPADYESFCTQARAHGLALPPIAPKGLVMAVLNGRRPSRVRDAFITFSSSWQARVLPVPTSLTLLGINKDRKAFRNALRPVFEEHRRPWATLGVFSRDR